MFKIRVSWSKLNLRRGLFIMKKKHVILLTVFIVILVIVLAMTVISKKIESNLDQLVVATIPDIDLTKLDDGVYTGSYQVFPISVKVKVTLSNHTITEIVLVKHVNGQGKAAEVIIDKVVSAQSLDVDNIAGATYSSRVILKAIENALNATSD